MFKLSGSICTCKILESWSLNSIHFSGTELYIVDLNTRTFRLLNTFKRIWKGNLRKRLHESWKRFCLLLLIAIALFYSLNGFPPASLTENAEKRWTFTVEKINSSATPADISENTHRAAKCTPTPPLLTPQCQQIIHTKHSVMAYPHTHVLNQRVEVKIPEQYTRVLFSAGKTHDLYAKPLSAYGLSSIKLNAPLMKVGIFFITFFIQFPLGSWKFSTVPTISTVLLL